MFKFLKSFFCIFSSKKYSHLPSKREAKAMAEKWIEENNKLAYISEIDDRDRSMGKELTSKMIAVIEIIPFKDIKVGLKDGDIVVFEGERRLTSHRAVAWIKEGESLRVKGSGNYMSDRVKVDITNYRGVVVKTIDFW